MRKTTGWTLGGGMGWYMRMAIATIAHTTGMMMIVMKGWGRWVAMGGERWGVDVAMIVAGRERIRDEGTGNAGRR